jgi:hypothetical protein
MVQGFPKSYKKILKNNVIFNSLYQNIFTAKPDSFLFLSIFVHVFSGSTLNQPDRNMKKNINTLLLFIKVVILLMICWFIFLPRHETRNLKKQLEETADELRAARDTIGSVKKNLKLLQDELDDFKLRSEMLSSQRDSLLLVFRRRNAASWEEAMRIEQQQKILKEKLLILRQTEKKLKW